MLGNLALLQPPDGIMGCWLPAWIVNATNFWRGLAGLFFIGMVRVTWKRVHEEEAMMKGAFGKEWEEWHKRTKRFVPGLF